MRNMPTPINSTRHANGPTFSESKQSESEENSSSTSKHQYADGNWSEGHPPSPTDSTMTRIPAALSEVLIDKEDSVHPSSGNDDDTSDINTARRTSDKMSPKDPTKKTPSSGRVNDNLWQIFSAKNCTYCCAAGSITLLGLSVACFTLPSISTYAEERNAVQAIGYTGGVLSLLFGIGTGLYVKSIYSQPERRFQ